MPHARQSRGGGEGAGASCSPETQGLWELDSVVSRGWAGDGHFPLVDEIVLLE